MGEVKTVNDALVRYKAEVSPEKKGARWENIRINAIQKHPHWPGKLYLSDVTDHDFKAWRDARAKKVKAGTLLRDIALVSGVMEHARVEWGWLSINPINDLSKPSKPDHRDRVISGPEIRALLRVLKWGRNRAHDTTQRKRVGHVLIHALQTGMRAGEICSLRWEDLRKNYCILRAEDTKSSKSRSVPLTPTAKRNIEMMRGLDETFVFGISSELLDAVFRRYRKLAKLDGFTFHDSRHTAATRIAQKLHVLDLCKMFGWTDPKRAMIYYNPSADDLAARLSAPAASIPTR